MHMAALAGDLPTLDALLKHAEKVEAKQQLDDVDRWGWAQGVRHGRALACLQAGSSWEMKPPPPKKTIVSNGPTPCPGAAYCPAPTSRLVNKTNASGLTPLHCACWSGGADAVKLLINHRAHFLVSGAAELLTGR